MAGPSRDHALDHVVVVLFENRSLDNVLGRLYRPGDGKTFEGVIGKDLSNPIPEWAEDGADRKVVPSTVATDMDSPNPDSGEEYPHTNTQLFGIQDEQNRFKLGEEITAPFNAPVPGQVPTMDGYVTDYISCFTAEMGPVPGPRPVPQFMEDPVAMGKSLSTLGKTLYQGIREYADQNHIEIEGLPKDPKADVPPEQALNVLRNYFATIFPLLAPEVPRTRAPRPDPDVRQP